MRSILLVNALAATAICSPAELCALQEHAGDEQEIDLCSALEAVGPGERLDVIVSGVVISGFEARFLFDPERPLCKWDVQPSTWLEFDLGGLPAAGRPREMLEGGPAFVKVRGVLLGPPAVPPDDPELSPGEALARRLSGIRRYGHLGSFRTQLLVRKVLEVGAIAEEHSAAFPVINRPEPSKGVGRAGEGILPWYPEMARRRGVSGALTMEVEVVAGRIASVDRLHGDRLLEDATVATIKSWRFGADVNERFATVFVYRLERRLTHSSRSERIELDLPWLVRVTAASDEW
jgi:hypothetical protein